MTKTWYSDLPQYYQRQIKALGLDEAGLTRRRMMKAMAATGAAIKKQELEQGKQTMEQMQLKLDQANQQVQQRAEQAGGDK